MTPSYQPLKSVRRTLDVLIAMNRRPVSSVRRLHADTKLPKSTLIRILETLVLSGFVAKDDNQAGYRLTSDISALSAGFHGGPRIVEVAAPICRNLTREIHWPTAIATLDVDAMVVRYSTIPEAPFAHVQSTLGKRLSLTGRAHGRAYLAFCPDSEKDILINMMARHPVRDLEISDGRRVIDQTLKETRRRGFATRDATLDPRTNTIAAPLFCEDRIMATIGITHFARALSPAQVATELAPRLIAGARKISEILSSGQLDAE